jgi:hypothetical protein
MSATLPGPPVTMCSGRLGQVSAAQVHRGAALAALAAISKRQCLRVIAFIEGLLGKVDRDRMNAL